MGERDHEDVHLMKKENSLKLKIGMKKIHKMLLLNIKDSLGSGCGSVGRSVASDTRDLWFKSRHRQNFIYQIIYQLFNRKDKNKEKEAGNRPSSKKKDLL